MCSVLLKCVFINPLKIVVAILGLLVADNENHLFSLHYVFLPRINGQLQVFQDAYARHHIRTARNRTPLQLWVEGHLAHSCGPEQDETLTQVQAFRETSHKISFDMSNTV